ncbi:MAG: hypothetical protein HOJ48_17400 [Desulfobacula sp.]|nr:hypothetical protein [Desulfobacula sp.]
MDSSLNRVILATLGGYIIILLFLSVYDWVEEKFPRRPTKQINSERIQHPLCHEEATKALKRFSQLSKSQKDAIKRNLRNNLISMEQWTADFHLFDYQIICIGELHEESTRRFLAERFFSAVNTDILLLEATSDKLKSLINRMNTGRDYFPLLDADIMGILRTVKNKNPDIRIWGIDQTDDQQKGQSNHFNSRDQSIAHNFWQKYKKGSHHIILFGALHCSNDSNWLFKNLLNHATKPLKEHMLNVNVLGEHQKGSLEAFVYFLDEIKIEKQTFVIPDTSALHPQIYQLFQSLNRQILEKYCSLIVFR